MSHRSPRAEQGSNATASAGFPVPACSAISRFDASKHSISHLSTSRQRLPDIHSRTLYSLALSHIRAHYHSLDLVFLTLLSTAHTLTSFAPLSCSHQNHPLCTASTSSAIPCSP